MITIPLVAPARAALSAPRSLAWRAVPPSEIDVAPLVRAGSALRRWHGRYVVVQDDVRALAVLEDDSLRSSTWVCTDRSLRTHESPGADASMPASAFAYATPLLLPVDRGGARTFDATRGNKAAKLDLEARVVLPDGRLLVVGSGSAPVRERFVLMGRATSADDDAARRRRDPAVRIVDASALYAQLHGTQAPQALALAQTNIEGAVVVDGRLRLFHRAVGMNSPSAHGARIPAVGDTATPTPGVRDTAAAMPAVGDTATPTRAVRDTARPRPLHALNAAIDFDLAAVLAWLDHGAAVPHVERVTFYDLGRAEGAVIGFTDAAILPDGRIAFLACAELTGDPTVDGRVVATRFGVLDGASGWQSEIVDGKGERILEKLEGLEPDDRPGCFHVVSDADDPGTPARIAGLAVRE